MGMKLRHRRKTLLGKVTKLLHPYWTGIYGYGYIHGYPRKVCGYGYGYGWEISYPRQPWRLLMLVPNFAILDENFQTKRRFSYSFSMAQNFWRVSCPPPCRPCHDATVCLDSVQSFMR